MTYELALKEREELGEKLGREKATLANLNSVMKKLNFSVEKAMEFLERVFTIVLSKYGCEKF